MAGSNQWVMGEGTDERFAWLENDEAGNVACIERLKGDPDIAAILEGEGGNPYLTTDEQWQAITDGIAAAPEMLALLTDVRYGLAYTLPLGERAKFEDVIANIDAVLAKAEPPRKVKRKVRVQVDVEVDVPRGTAFDCDLITRIVKDSVTADIGGQYGDPAVVRAKATNVGELYEE